MSDEGIAILCALYSHLYEPSESEGDRLAQYFSKEDKMQVNMSQVAKIIDDENVLPSEKMENLLVALSMVQTEARERAAPFDSIIEAEQAMKAEAIKDLGINEARIRQGLVECLEVFFEHENWKFKGEAGTAQMVKPKARISYDTKGLETLRLSSDETDRLIGHLRVEKPTKPYLKIKLKA